MNKRIVVVVGLALCIGCHTQKKTQKAVANSGNLGDTGWIDTGYGNPVYLSIVRPDYLVDSELYRTLKRITWNKDVSSDGYSWQSTNDRVLGSQGSVFPITGYCPPHWPVCNYDDTPFDHFNAYIRYQMPWFNGGREIINRVLRRIPEDSMKVWIGKKTWDSLENIP